MHYYHSHDEGGMGGYGFFGLLGLGALALLAILFIPRPVRWTNSVKKAVKVRQTESIVASHCGPQPKVHLLTLFLFEVKEVFKGY